MSFSFFLPQEVIPSSVFFRVLLELLEFFFPKTVVIVGRVKNSHPFQRYLLLSRAFSIVGSLLIVILIAFLVGIIFPSKSLCSYSPFLSLFDSFSWLIFFCVGPGYIKVFKDPPGESFLFLCFFPRETRQRTNLFLPEGILSDFSPSFLQSSMTAALSEKFLRFFLFPFLSYGYFLLMCSPPWPAFPCLQFMRRLTPEAG